jgi:putative transcriptional regulator
MDEAGFLTGQMLIAMPGIGDPRFERALVLICAHDEHHAMGLAVNRPVEGLTVADLLRRLDVPNAAKAPADLVLMGGPVERERGFVLHTDDYQGHEDNSLQIGEGVALTATRDALEAMTGSGNAPRRSALALGYAGWGAGQLEDEILHNSWLNTPVDSSILFTLPARDRWQAATRLLGVDVTQLTASAGHA